MKQMKAKILVSGLLAILLFGGCTKNTYNTKPTLKITSINGNVFENGSTMILQIQVTDKEGDVTDSLFMRRIRLNQNVRATTAVDSIYFKVPDAPNTTDGTIQLNLGYTNYLAAAIDPGNQNDTLVFKFALRDRAGNVSDTISTEPIVAIRQ